MWSADAFGDHLWRGWLIEGLRRMADFPATDGLLDGDEARDKILLLLFATMPVPPFTDSSRRRELPGISRQMH